MSLGLIGLDDETKRRLALVLQGTKKGPGRNIRFLNFKGSDEERDCSLQ